MEESRQYQLGSWVLCPRTNTITNDVDTHSIDNKSMQVLLFLMRHAGEDVTKSQIFAHVWRNSVVTDDILSVAISKIRKALGDNARSPSYIKTLPGVGYKLIATVEEITAPEQEQEQEQSSEAESSKSSYFYASIFALMLIVVISALYFAPTDQDATAKPITINSIAVLPFDDLSTNQDNQYFSDGLSDAIINQLSQIQQLKVISRFSSFTYRRNYNALEVGQALQVNSLLDGSVQTMGDMVRINVRIISTEDGQQLWSRTFDSEIQDVFKLQDNISAAIQEVIQPNFTPDSTPTRAISAQAYEWYLMGQYHWRQRNPQSLYKAETYFKHSLELAPDYAEAHVGLAITYANLHHFGNWDERKAADAALPHIEKALELTPDSPTALAAQGMVLTLKANSMGYAGAPVFQQAKQAFLRSLALDDNSTTHHWYSSLLRRLGEEQQVVQHMHRAIELNPLSASLKRTFSEYLRLIGKPDSAQRMYQRALILEPDHFSYPIDSTHVFRHTQDSITALAEWHSINAELFAHCSSDEYCEQVVLAYLSIGATEAANSVLANMGPKHRHFVNSLALINYGAKGEAHNALSLKERLASRRTYSRLAMYNLAVAQFRAEEFSQAKNSLITAYPDWVGEALIDENVITANNYSALVLYASILSKLEQHDVAQGLLHNLQAFLKQGKVFDKIQAEFTLAEINAQLNNPAKALLHLATAIEMGWVEHYDNEWWPLQDNHLLQPLNNEPEFQLLLNQHQENLSELRNRINRQLGVTPG